MDEKGICKNGNMLRVMGAATLTGRHRSLYKNVPAGIPTTYLLIEGAILRLIDAVEGL